MAKFKIIITETTYASIIVEANSKEEVEEKIYNNEYNNELGEALMRSGKLEQNTEVEEIDY